MKEIKSLDDPPPGYHRRAAVGTEFGRFLSRGRRRRRRTFGSYSNEVF